MIKFVYFKEAVNIRTKNATRPYHVISSDRFDFEMTTDTVVVDCDGYITVIPLHMVGSFVLDKKSE